jgi:hypothetical protein
MCSAPAGWEPTDRAEIHADPPAVRAGRRHPVLRTAGVSFERPDPAPTIVSIWSSRAPLRGTLSVPTDEGVHIRRTPVPARPDPVPAISVRGDRRAQLCLRVPRKWSPQASLGWWLGAEQDRSLAGRFWSFGGITTLLAFATPVSAACVRSCAQDVATCRRTDCSGQAGPFRGGRAGCGRDIGTLAPTSSRPAAFRARVSPVAGAAHPPRQRASALLPDRRDHGSRRLAGSRITTGVCDCCACVGHPRAAARPR